MTLKLAVENAIRKAAPEISSVVAEDAATGANPPLLQIEVMPGVASDHPADGGWTMAGGLPDLREGASLIKTVGGQAVMFLSVAGRLLGYRPRCPACGDPLADALVLRTDLICPGCGNRYDVLRAGRCLDSPSLQLEPVPLLRGEDGLVRIALGAPV
jgi:nitrite reductase/ring-hydroxylating ferredoxin subunit